MVINYYLFSVLHLGLVFHWHPSLCHSCRPSGPDKALSPGCSQEPQQTASCTPGWGFWGPLQNQRRQERGNCLPIFCCHYEEWWYGTLFTTTDRTCRLQSFLFGTSLCKQLIQIKSYYQSTNLVVYCQWWAAELWQVWVCDQLIRFHNPGQASLEECDSQTPHCQTPRGENQERRVSQTRTTMWQCFINEKCMFYL